MPVMKRCIVGVMGSGTDAHEELARPLGQWLARRGVHLLTGGGGGVMASVAKAFVETAPRGGICLGVLPTVDGRATPQGYPNPWIEVPILTPLPRYDPVNPVNVTRNHVNILTCDSVVLLPGGGGTQHEGQLCADYGKPHIGLESPEQLQTVFAFIEKSLS